MEFLGSIKKKNLLFIHTRLSIIDLNKSSDQPLSDNEGILIFNGMIYNFLELRKMLKKKRLDLKLIQILKFFLNF